MTRDHKLTKASCKSYGQNKGYDVKDIGFWWILSKCTLSIWNKSMIVKMIRTIHCMQTTFSLSSCLIWNGNDSEGFLQEVMAMCYPCSSFVKNFRISTSSPIKLSGKINLWELLTKSSRPGRIWTSYRKTIQVAPWFLNGAQSAWLGLSNLSARKNELHWIWNHLERIYMRGCNRLWRVMFVSVCVSPFMTICL